jgi:hypothetical protein
METVTNIFLFAFLIAILVLVVFIYIQTKNAYLVGEEEEYQEEEPDYPDNQSNTLPESYV